MSDILTQIYYAVDSSLPHADYPHPAEEALTATFTEQQQELFEAYTAEAVDEIDQERMRLFYFTLRLALHIP